MQQEERGEGGLRSSPGRSGAGDRWAPRTPPAALSTSATLQKQLYKRPLPYCFLDPFPYCSLDPRGRTEARASTRQAAAARPTGPAGPAGQHRRAGSRGWSNGWSNLL
jgi:hypothetical protein